MCGKQNADLVQQELRRLTEPLNIQCWDNAHSVRVRVEFDMVVPAGAVIKREQRSDGDFDTLVLPSGRRVIPRPAVHIDLFGNIDLTGHGDASVDEVAEKEGISLANRVVEAIISCDHGWVNTDGENETKTR